MQKKKELLQRLPQVAKLLRLLRLKFKGLNFLRIHVGLGTFNPVEE
jgi:S-adenosylmethionine:tRNA-ribosyltransferase-isomerase (queuine synthetase)